MFSKKGKFAREIFLLNTPEMPVYLIRGNKNYLIDAAFTFMGPQILKDIAEIGITPHFLLLTHSHYDHVGAAPFLKKVFPNMKIVASTRTAEILKKPKAISLIKQLEKEAEKIFKVKEHIEFEPFDVDIEVKDGDQIEEFEVLETPGHTRCSISFVFPAEKIIFVGDAAGVIEKGYIRPQFLSDYKQYLSSLEKIKNYSHLSLALGHGGIFPEGKEFIEKSIERTKEFKDEILNLYNKFKDQTVVAEEIYKREYEGIGLHQPKEAYMINLKAMIRSALSS